MIDCEVDMENAATVEQAILKAVFDRFSAVAVDLTNLSYMDSVLFDLASRVVGSQMVTVSV